MSSNFGSKLTKFLISSAVSATFIACGMCMTSFAKTITVAEKSISSSEATSDYTIQDGDTVVFDSALSSYNLSTLKSEDDTSRIKAKVSTETENLKKILSSYNEKMNHYKALKLSDGSTDVFSAIKDFSDAKLKEVMAISGSTAGAWDTLKYNVDNSFNATTFESTDIPAVVTKISELLTEINGFTTAISTDRTNAETQIKTDEEAVKKAESTYKTTSSASNLIALQDKKGNLSTDKAMLEEINNAEQDLKNFVKALSQYETKTLLTSRLIPSEQKVTIKYLGDKIKLTGEISGCKVSNLILKKGVNGTSSIEWDKLPSDAKIEYAEADQKGEEEKEVTDCNIVVPTITQTIYPDMKLNNDKLNLFADKNGIKHVNKAGETVPGTWKWVTSNEEYEKMNPGETKTMQIKFVAKDGTETAGISIKVMKWGTQVINDGIVNYTADGYTMVEIRSGKKAYLCENDRWFFVDNSDNVFDDGSQFWVKIITASESPTEYETYKALIDPTTLAVSDDDNRIIYLMGVTSPDGSEYEYLRGQTTVGMQISSDWKASDLAMYRLKDKTDTELLSTITKESFGHSGDSRTFFAFKTDHFSPYLFSKKLSSSSTSSAGSSSGSSSSSSGSSSSLGSLLGSSYSSSYKTTGDSFNIYSYGAFCALAFSSIFVAKLSKKRSENA